MLPILNTDSPTLLYVDNRLTDTSTDAVPIYWEDEDLNTWQFSAEKKSICEDIGSSTINDCAGDDQDEHDSLIATFSDVGDQVSSNLDQVHFQI